ncbi:MAG: hypothetical protein EOO61_14820, partial [Hymenobacter sp.]
MHTLTFLRKPLSSRVSWRTFLSVLAFIVSLSSAQVALAQNPTFFDESVTFTAQPTGAVSTDRNYAGAQTDAPYSGYTSLGSTSVIPNISNPSLGVYDINTPRTSNLVFTGGSLVARRSYDPDLGDFVGTITATRLLYRIYLSTANTLPNYSTLTLNEVGSFAGSTKRLYNNTISIDLLAGLTGGGTYVFDVQYQIDLQTSKGTTTYTDPSASYQANFTVSAPAVTPTGGTTIWQSKSSSDWFLASNWTNGVPNSASNAIIPENAEGTNIIFPVLNNLSRHYVVNNLTLQGNTGSSKAQITILNAVFRVYGNIFQLTGGLVGSYSNAIGVADSLQNSALVLAGANQ